MVFGYGQPPSSTAFESVWTIRFAHTPYSFRSSSFSPHRWRQSTKYAWHTSVAYTLLLPCGGSATCWRLPSLNTELMLCFACTKSRLIQVCHAKQPTPMQHFRMYHTYSVAPVNAWRRTVAHKWLFLWRVNSKDKLCCKVSWYKSSISYHSRCWWLLFFRRWRVFIVKIRLLRQ